MTGPSSTAPSDTQSPRWLRQNLRRWVLLWAWVALLGWRVENSRAATNAALPALVLHQQLLEGYLSDALDPGDPLAIFAHVFARLPESVTVYPSENYYYFQLAVGGRQLWGNMRLAVGLREKGLLSFGYAEFPEFPSLTTNRFVRERILGTNDGVRVTGVLPLVWQLTYREKAVLFHLHALRQEPPARFPLGPSEEFVMRTFDESGCQFFLMYYGQRPSFFWVLNEEEPIPDHFDRVTDDLEVGRRTGFAYWRDTARGGRRVLLAVRRAVVQRNDYFDGPFDQLADNDVEKTHVASYINRVYPVTVGKIDALGYWTNRTDQFRVGIAAYGMYEKRDDLLDFLKRAKAAPDFFEFIGHAQDSRPKAAAESPKK